MPRIGRRVPRLLRRLLLLPLVLAGLALAPAAAATDRAPQPSASVRAAVPPDSFGLVASSPELQIALLALVSLGVLVGLVTLVIRTRDPY